MGLQAAFLMPARASAALGSPFMDRPMTRLAGRQPPPDTALTQLLDRWTGGVSPSGASRLLRLAGRLQALVLSGPDTPLAAAYPPLHIVGDEDLLGAVFAALRRHDEVLVPLWPKPRSPW